MTVDMSCFKKLSDKKTLLDEAVRLGDGDVVCAVLLHLQRTLDQSVLLDILKDRCTASRQYIVILVEQNRHEEAADLCVALKRPKEAAVHLYNSCFSDRGRSVISNLDRLRKQEFRRLSNVEMETEIVRRGGTIGKFFS